ncbi:MAG: tetratricopeptide repeat protein [Candidatus Acidiferrum sp.]
MKKRQPSVRNLALVVLLTTFIFCTSVASARDSDGPSLGQNHTHSEEGIYLVFPFENIGTSPRLDWIGEGLEELTIQWLSSAKQLVYSHDGRVNEMDRTGLPSTGKLSRATMLHVAQEMDADFIIFGNFTSDGKTLTISARVLRVNPVSLLPMVQESGPLDSLMDLQSKVIWRLLGTNDHNYYLSFSEFSKLQRPVRLDAFEQYIRGLLANEDEIRIRDLKEAARLEPDWPEPSFALGETYYARNDCAAALPWFARVPATHQRTVEAVFATGVCRLKLGQPDRAEQTFASLQEGLEHNSLSGADLPEILNNLALARIRLGNLPAALSALERARDIDPDEDDYPFNLGLVSMQQEEFATAAMHFSEAVQREPDNSEDYAFLIYSLERCGKKPEAEQERVLAEEAFGRNGLPLVKLDGKADSFNKYERVKRELDTTALRLDLQDPRAQQHAVTATNGTPEKDAPAGHVRAGRQDLSAGKLDAADAEFRAALKLDPNNATAHREMAEVYRKRGKLDDAVQELKLSLAARDSAVTRVVLARIYLEEKKTDLARAEVEKAVKLAPNYAEARELLEHMDQSKSTGGVQ